jgi:hypothetical protein
MNFSWNVKKVYSVNTSDSVEITIIGKDQAYLTVWDAHGNKVLVVSCDEGKHPIRKMGVDGQKVIYSYNIKPYNVDD